MALLLYFAVVLFSAAQSVSAKLYGKGGGNASFFNAVKALSACLLFALLSAWGFSFHLPTLLFALLYGISLGVSMLSGYLALLSGPMALTSMLVSFSVAIPVLAGFFAYGEAPTAFRILGLAALFCATFLVGRGGKESEKTVHGKWLLYVFLTFLTNGACSVIQKQHQTLFPGEYLEEFMLFSMILPALAFGARTLLKHSFSELKREKNAYLGVLSGAANGVAGYATLALAGLENASVLFPAVSAGTIMTSLLCGCLIFKERLRAKHFAALLFGICAVVLLKL